MNILVPVDFSTNSLSALYYAIELKERMSANITLFHSVEIPNLLPIGENQIGEIGKTEAQNELKKIQAHIKKDFSFDINFDFDLSHPIEGIKNYVNNTQTDIVIMSTTGANNIRKYIGTVACGVIRNVKVPVMVIPSNYTFRPINNILLPTNLINLKEELETVISFAKLFKSQINILHILEKGKTETESNNIINDSIKEVNELNITSSILDKTSNISGSIETYSQKSETDLIAMFTYATPTLFEFLDAHGTTELAMLNKFPILSIKKI